jgi:hypothetical protein
LLVGILSALSQKVQMQIRILAEQRTKTSIKSTKTKEYVMFITLLMFIISFTLCVAFIRSKWKIYSGSWFPLIDSLRSYNILSRVWPCDDGFMSLIFSAFRHTLIPVIFAFLIWFVNNDLLSRFLLFLSLGYAFFIIPRYKERKKDYDMAGENSQQMLKPVKSACFSVIVCAFANYFILLICYAYSLQVC